MCGGRAVGEYALQCDPVMEWEGKVNEGERQKFEAWYKENYCKIAGTSSWVERAWAVWQAARAEQPSRTRAAALEEAAKVCESFSCHIVGCTMIGCPDWHGSEYSKAASAIRALAAAVPVEDRPALTPTVDCRCPGTDNDAFCSEHHNQYPHDKQGRVYL